MSFEEELRIAHAQLMSEEEFINKHDTIPKDWIKKVNFMTDQLIQGTWRGLSLDMVDGLFLEKQKVKDFLSSKVSDESGMVVFDFNEVKELGL